MDQAVIHPVNQPVSHSAVPIFSQVIGQLVSQSVSQSRQLICMSVPTVGSQLHILASAYHSTASTLPPNKLVVKAVALRGNTSISTPNKKHTSKIPFQLFVKLTTEFEIKLIW